MQALKIVAGVVLFAIAYGIIHDQITARVCLQYFTVFHPPVFPTTSPTLLAIGWGTIATWWGGAVVGILVAITARAGPLPKLTLSQLAWPLLILTAVMACCALLAGLIGYSFAPVPATFAAALPPDMDHRCVADWWAHGASYLSGFAGGLVLCAAVLVRRRALRAASSPPV